MSREIQEINKLRRPMERKLLAFSEVVNVYNEHTAERQALYDQQLDLLFQGMEEAGVNREEELFDMIGKVDKKVTNQRKHAKFTSFELCQTWIKKQELANSANHLNNMINQIQTHDEVEETLEEIIDQLYQKVNKETTIYQDQLILFGNQDKAQDFDQKMNDLAIFKKQEAEDNHKRQKKREAENKQKENNEAKKEEALRKQKKYDEEQEEIKRKKEANQKQEEIDRKLQEQTQESNQNEPEEKEVEDEPEEKSDNIVDNENPQNETNDENKDDNEKITSSSNVNIDLNNNDDVIVSPNEETSDGISPGGTNTMTETEMEFGTTTTTDFNSPTDMLSPEVETKDESEDETEDES